MSRIHEALQRAYIERGKLSDPGPVGLVDHMDAIPQFEDLQAPPPPPAQPRVEVPIENVAQHPWNPSMLSFPTLAERGAGVEQFRSLRSHIYQARYEAPLKTILIASGMPAEGKSFVAANLAVSLARNSIHHILLIDCDLRRPTLHNLLGAPNTRGLAEYLTGNANLNEIMQRDSRPETKQGEGLGGIPNLTFIPSGKCSDNSSELVANHRFEELLAAVSSQFDWIIIDAPPVLAVTDAVELSRAADAVMLVARAGSTPYEVTQRAKAAFGASRILGVVLNGIQKAPHTGSYSYNYNYYHSEGQDAGASARETRSSGRQE